MKMKMKMKMEERARERERERERGVAAANWFLSCDPFRCEVSALTFASQRPSSPQWQIESKSDLMSSVTKKL